MKVGYVIRNSGEAAITSVRSMPHIAEELGFAAVWLTDHVIGLRSFAPVYEPEWAEILASLSHMAATTSSIRLGTGVLVVPYRDPVLTAKMIATIDQLSEGRVILGIGTGWSKGEYAALGRLDHFDARGRVTDEALDVMVACWRGERLAWNGTAFNFRDITFAPTTVQRPHPAIWVGGQTGPAIRRAARIGDAWHPTNIPPAEVARLGDRLDASTDRRVPRTIRLGVPADEIDGVEDLLSQYEEAGCVEAAIQIRHSDYDYEVQLDLMRKLAKRVAR
ncbi:MAG TPA: TIGR03619 family F420-dependent LLM class oxidoreductase [Amycolatopsis sp.]|nr:TIGR03619 family F420-dependent LLM class oxidoreductase [Amycolatopsis sp.]